MNFELRIATPTLAAGWHHAHEFTVANPPGISTVYARTYTDGNPEWGMPMITIVTVAAEQWRDGMDGDGETVATVEGLAALLGCEATAEAVARYLDEVVTDHHVGQEELRHER